MGREGLCSLNREKNREPQMTNDELNIEIILNKEHNVNQVNKGLL